MRKDWPVKAHVPGKPYEGYGLLRLLRGSDRVLSRAICLRDSVARWLGIREVLTAPQSPWQNAYVERLIGSIRRECLEV